ncbi:MAG: hypothetical protein ABFS09_05530 [Thermodesulfobacteriota bacterium]
MLPPSKDISFLESLPPGAPVGIVGVPPLEVMAALEKSNASIFDLDESIVKRDMEETILYLPRVYCAILRTVVINSLHLDLKAIVIDVGPGKCDCALHVATILADRLEIPVIQTRNIDTTPFGTPLCKTDLNLPEKMARICKSIQTTGQHEELPVCRATAGFWGVPPRDFSLLALFPPTTHVYGWSRCMENKTPADLKLESHYNPDLPTVFFAQSFCAKTALAKHLASKHPRALFLDSDISAGSSIRAKIQAFLELSGVYDASC